MVNYFFLRENLAESGQYPPIKFEELLVALNKILGLSISNN